jgi:integrase
MGHYQTSRLSPFAFVRYNPADLLGRMLGRMARQTKRLTARSAATLAKPGLYADGDGLYLKVDPSGARRWYFIFRWHGKSSKFKRAEMGLGRLADVGLAEARQKAAEARRLVAEGRNPIDVRRQAVSQRRRAVPTFGEVADDYIAAHESSFRNPKHIAQWRMTLGNAYCKSIRSRPIDEISTEHILEVLQPIWRIKNETASRIRGRIERVIDAAKARGHRQGENPARWRGHMDKLLSKRQKLSRGHHPALPYADLPAFLTTLRTVTGIGALALEFLIFAAARTGEVIGAEWSEFNLTDAVWTVPPARMKAQREHRVALSAPAVTVLRRMEEVRTSSPFVFVGSRPTRPISNMTMTKALSAAGGDKFTVHGFRSTFRDWVAEETSFPGELAEAALAHVSGDETERAYRRGDQLEKRRRLMEAWANFCLGAPTALHLVSDVVAA